jgi:predicted ATPase/class 3 adenylate cyclase/Tfp pilus assembly protein PilF
MSDEPRPPGAPLGTVTFLLTDIEGSTARWEEYPQAMKVALALHDKILRGAIETNGGYIFQTIGDAFCAAFSTAVGALTAAISAQQALYQQDWGEIGFMRVRMALHTGDAGSTDGTYSGAAFDRAARLLPIGHGGQTLMTIATEQLVCDLLPPVATLLDMGERRFRDLLHSERVYSLQIKDLPHDFPPLKTLEGTPNNLPIRSTSLVGREKELEECRMLLGREDVRLLTLLGPGGIGKTRLALHLGASMLDDFADGVFAVALAHVTEPALVAPTLAQALSVRQISSRSTTSVLIDYLRGKQILLILDNFEQLLEAAPLIWELLSAAPGLKIIVTSRSALDLAAEHIYQVPALSLPELGEVLDTDDIPRYEALNLFAERARAVKPDFTLTIENIQAVVGVCAQLDGLPLAVELAAARIKILSPQAMLSRLSGRLKLLTGGGQDLPERQKTLRATIEWSHELLNADEKKLFRWFSVFINGAPFEAVEAIATPNPDGDDHEQVHIDGDVLDTLSSLVSKSLVRHLPRADGTMRFGMLSTMREYGLERLTEFGEQAAISERHARFYMALAEDAEPGLRGSAQVAWLRTLETEHDNLQAALAWATEHHEVEVGLRIAGALWRFWYINSYLSEGRNWLLQLLSLPQPPGIDAIRGKALNGAGSLIYNQGDYGLAQSLHEECLQIARKTGDRRSVAGALNNLGLIAKIRNHYDEAYSLFEQALEVNRATGNRSWEAINYNNMGNVRYDQGDYVGARTFQEQSVALFVALGDSWGMAMSLAELGRVAFEQGNYGEARDLNGRSLGMQRDLGDKRNVADTLNKLGAVALNQGEYAEARDLFEQSLTLFRDLGDKRGMAASLHYLGVVAYRRGDYATARVYLEESLRSRMQLGDKRDIAESHNNLGIVAMAQGDYARAEVELTLCLQLWRELGNKALIPLSLNNLGLVAVCLGEFDRAVTLLEECLEASKTSGWRLGVALALLNLGLARGGQGDYTEAERLYNESLGMFEALGNKLHLATCLVRLAALAALTGAPEKALLLAGAANGVFEQLGISIPPFERPYYEPAIEAARVLLGEEQAAILWDKGCGLRSDEIVSGSYLQELSPVSLDHSRESSSLAE